MYNFFKEIFRIFKFSWTVFFCLLVPVAALYASVYLAYNGPEWVTEWNSYRVNKVDGAFGYPLGTEMFFNWPLFGLFLLSTALSELIGFGWATNWYSVD